MRCGLRGTTPTSETMLGGAARRRATGRPAHADLKTYAVSFEILTAAVGTSARRGVRTTRRGAVQTPAFMPVGTQATVKPLLPREVPATGADILLCNTYHLMLRPG